MGATKVRCQMYGLIQQRASANWLCDGTLASRQRLWLPSDVLASQTPVLPALPSLLAKLFGRHAGRLLEGHTKTVRALISTHAREGFDLVIAFAEQLLGALNADTMELLPRSAAKMFKESLMKAAPRHGSDPN